MTQTADFLKRSAIRCGFKREFFIEKNIPTSPSNIMAVPFFGDLRSTCILSSLVLKSYKERCGKYLVVCSWPGFRGLFPYADEYWSFEDESVLRRLATDANNFYNTGSLATEINRNLIECMDTLSYGQIKELYDQGITQKYWDEFGQVNRYLPEVPSSSRLASTFIQEIERKQGRKIVIYPSTKMFSWQKGRAMHLSVSKEFWRVLVESLMDRNYQPVVYQNWFTYDLSRDFTDRCIYLVPKSISDVLAAMRHIGLNLDIHSGFSRLAILGRSPFVAADERLRFVECRDYEYDDLCCETPRRYVFSFSTMLMAGGSEEWKTSLIDNVLATLDNFSSGLDRETWGSSNESYGMVPYNRVRQRNARRLGVRFIRTSKEK